MSKAGIIFIGSCIVIALAFMIPAFDFPGGSSDGAPGPGYFPVILCVIILILSIILAVSYLRHKEKYFQTNQTERNNLGVFLITGGAVILYTIMFIFLPFIPLTIAFIIFLNRLYKRTWKFNITFSIAFTLIMYVIFSKFLHVML
ncbi:MAG: tripartite tricarboxylate transporter TctB family protein [Spirochaetales bacterium]|nr:tripartite tricarboxylate transporter TctB family protein [Spirochaetales bacterium]